MCCLCDPHGIDWSKVIDGAPSGRAFHYIEPFASKQMIKKGGDN